MSVSLWHDPIFTQTFWAVFGTLLLLSIGFFFVRTRNPQLQAGWASLVSWCIAAPIMFALIAAPGPWALIGLTLVAIFGMKIYFQMVGMYHRSNFVWVSYLGLIGLAFCLYHGYRELYNLAPMLFFGTICWIPILRNSPKQMIQYLGLSLMGFMFLGWSFMYLGWIYKLDRGPYMVVYIMVLTEVYDNLSLAYSRLFGGHKMFSKITPRRNWEGFAFASALTLLLAFSLRHLLPERSMDTWLATGLATVLGGSLGDLVLSVVRRDLGIKDVGVFIIGRGDLLSVMDRLIFVAPIFYYVMWWLENEGHWIPNVFFKSWFTS